MTDWLSKIHPLTPSAITPVHQDKPSVWFTIIVFAICVSPVVGFVIWGWM